MYSNPFRDNKEKLLEQLSEALNKLGDQVDRIGAPDLHSLSLVVDFSVGEDTDGTLNVCIRL